MSLFLSPYIGAGTKLDPYRPVGLDVPGASAIDIRLDPTRADGNGIGFALLWVPGGIPDPAGAIKLADDYGDLLTNQQRNRLNQWTGLDFGVDTTIQDAIETILLRADAILWKQLRPTNGMYEAWLGSGSGKRKWVDLPVLAGGSISDNFNRANETPVASPWTQLAGSTGTINLASNAVTKASAGDTFYYYAHPGGWSAGQSSEFLYASSITGNDWGPAVRVGASGFSGYWYSQHVGGSGSREINKYVAGTFSLVELVTGTSSVGTRYKIDANGSTIRYYDGGVENASSPVTDTSLSTSGNGAGLFLYDTGGSLDDFLATGELSAGAKGALVSTVPLKTLIGYGLVN